MRILGTRVTADSLLRHADFRNLWAADTASQLGAAVGGLAIPFLAVTVLHASQFQMGLLGTLESLGFLVVALPAGALIDRLGKRQVMLTADLGRAVLLLTIVAASLFGLLTMLQVMVIATAVGVLTVFFDVSYQSYLPVLIPRDKVVDGNSKLQMSQSVSGFAGPAVGGLMLSRAGGPAVLGINAAGYLASAAWLWRIRYRESPAPRNTRPGALRLDIVEGLRFILGHRLLRRLIACTGISNFFSSGVGVLSVLFMLRELHLSAFTIGVLASVSAFGGLAGAATTGRLARVLGEGGTVVATAAIMAVTAFALPLASILPPVPVLAAGGIITSASVVAYNVATVSFRQRLCPPRLLGRMNASARFLVWGTVPLGAFVGGTVGSALGVRPTLWLLAAGGVLALLPVAGPGVWRLRRLPEYVDDDPPPVSSSPAVDPAGPQPAGPIEPEQVPTQPEPTEPVGRSQAS